MKHVIKLTSGKAHLGQKKNIKKSVAGAKKRVRNRSWVHCSLW